MSRETDGFDPSDDPYSKHRSRCFAKGKQELFSSRPNASGGLWLSSLLPLAISSIYIKNSAPCAISTIYEHFAVAAWGMWLQSICYFINTVLNLGMPINLCICCSPTVLTTILHKWLIEDSLYSALFWGFGITYTYQRIYVLFMKKFPYCFTYGECTIFVQGLILFLLNAYQKLPAILKGEYVGSEHDDLTELSVIMLFALCCLDLTAVMVFRVKLLQTTAGFYSVLALVASAIFFAPITDPVPLNKVLQFIFNDRRRCLTVMFYGLLVLITALTIIVQVRHTEKASTRIRKIFHVLILFVFVPGILFECSLLYLATGVALACFFVLEIIRFFHIPPLGESLEKAFASFSDSKDSGSLALTPICLLIGCALPLWISPCTCRTTQGNSLLLHLSGILAVGFGDTAASVIGSQYGKHKWSEKTSRSIEGSIAFVISVLLAVGCLSIGQFVSMSQSNWFFTILATITTALVEAHTDQIDNLVLPIVFYIIINLG